MDSSYKLIFFHFAKIELGASGSSVRPYNMLKAFKALGISVEEVSGEREEREEKIRQLKQRIIAGERFNMLYVENTTLPLGLLQFRTKHFSYYKKYSNDKEFIQFCLDQNIQCSYYYRDIHWDFPEAFESSYSFLKRKYLLLYQQYFGRKELSFLKNKVRLYVPSDLFKEYLEKKYQLQAEALPPGSNININASMPKSSKLTMIYVGGLSSLYFSDHLIRELEKVQLIVQFILCCRKEEFEKNKTRFKHLKNIEVYHTSGNELLQLYNRAHFALFPLKPEGYGKLSYSIKIPEYICNAKPIVAFKNNTCASIIEKHQVGWTIGEEEGELFHLFKRLANNVEEIEEKVANTLAVREQFTWKEVAKKVIQER